MAYRAEIEIGVKGVRFLDELQNKLTQVSKTIEQVNRQQVVIRRTIAGAASTTPMGPGGAGVTSASAQAAAYAVERRVAELRRTEAQTAIKSVKDRAFAENYIAGVVERRIQAKQKELAIERQQTAEIIKQQQLENQQSRQALTRRAGGAISSGLIGGGFPLLFGQGAGAAAGGAVGGIAGGLLGGGFGFALSVIGTAIGQAADESDKFTRSLAQLNAGASRTGSNIKITATDVSNLAKNLGVAKDEAIKLLSAFSGFNDARTTQSLLAVFGEDPGTFKALAAVQDKADLAKVILNNYEKISAETALQLINQLKLTDSATVELAFQKALLDAEIKKTEQGLKQVTIQDRLLAGLATAGALMGGSATFISPEVFGQERVKQFRAQRPQDPIQGALKALGILKQANAAAESLRPDTKAANAAERAAEKAARDAEREAQRVAEEVRSRQLSSIELKKQLAYTEKIAQAELNKDEILSRELEGEFELVRLGIETARQLEKEKDTRVQLAIARESQLKRDLVILKTNLDITKLEAKRAEEYKNLLRDLDYELQIKDAVTEQDRERLRIEAEIQRLRDQGIYTESQLLAIQEKKQQLVKPVLGVELLRREIGSITDELNVLTDIGTQVISGAKAIGDAFSTSFKGIISSTMTAQEALANFFQNVADQFLDMAAQIIAKWIQMTILNSVLSLFPGSSAGTKTDSVGQFNAAVLQYRANGGPVSAGSPYIVGERGPELFVPGRSGTIVPNDQMGGSKVEVGSINISVENTGEALSAQAQKQIANQVQGIVMATLVNERRSGGVLR